jgi:hypothetical protein
MSRKNYQLKFILWPVLVLFFVSTILLAIEVSTLGATLVNLEQEELKLVKENRELSNQLIQASSLKKVGEKSQDLGFIKPTKILYIGKDEVVARLP